MKDTSGPAPKMRICSLALVCNERNGCHHAKHHARNEYCKEKCGVMKEAKCVSITTALLAELNKEDK